MSFISQTTASSVHVLQRNAIGYCLLGHSKWEWKVPRRRLDAMLVLLECDLEGQSQPPDQNFQSPVWGSSSTSGSLKLSNPSSSKLHTVHGERGSAKL